MNKIYTVSKDEVSVLLGFVVIAGYAVVLICAGFTAFIDNEFPERNGGITIIMVMIISIFIPTVFVYILLVFSHSSIRKQKSSSKTP